MHLSKQAWGISWRPVRKAKLDKFTSLQQKNHIFGVSSFLITVLHLDHYKDMHNMIKKDCTIFLELAWSHWNNHFSKHLFHVDRSQFFSYLCKTSCWFQKEQGHIITVFEKQISWLEQILLGYLWYSVVSISRALYYLQCNYTYSIRVDDDIAIILISELAG